MIRKENWVILLDEYLKTKENLPFCFGSNDCCLFAAGAVKSMSGVDLSVEFRGKYRNEIGAARSLKKYSGGGVRELMEKISINYGMIESKPLMLSRGDIALIYQNDRESLGIIDLTGMRIVAPGISGTVSLPIDEAITGWSICAI